MTPQIPLPCDKYRSLSVLLLCRGEQSSVTSSSGVTVLLSVWGGAVTVGAPPPPATRHPPVLPTCRVISIAHQAPFPQSNLLPVSAITGNEAPVSTFTPSLAATVCDSSHMPVC